MNYMISEGVVFRPLNDDLWAVWNRFSPSVMIMSANGAGWLKNARIDNRMLAEGDLVEDQLEIMLGNRLIYHEGVDPYRAQFHKSLDDALAEVYRISEASHGDGLPYGNLQITNSICNLGCPYCICSHTKAFDLAKRPRSIIGYEEHFSILCNIVDQFVSSQIRTEPTSQIPISFNGGEILLDWKKIKSLILYLKSKYPEIKFAFSMNTNMTLMTEEIAQFLAADKTNIYISIDGYEETHDRTRFYKGAKHGKGTFSDVMSATEIYNSKRPDARIKAYLGTIANVDDFDQSLFFKMARKGFTGARLAPNLFNGNPDYGRRAAILTAKMQR